MPAKGKRTSGLLTQQKMLRGAVSLFLEKGYEGTTTAEIARAAGMTPSSFFRAYPSKEALLLELVYTDAYIRMHKRRQLWFSAVLFFSSAFCLYFYSFIIFVPTDGKISACLWAA